MATKLEKARPKILSALEQSTRIFTRRELEQLIRSSRSEWNLEVKTTSTEVIDFLQEKGKLQKLKLRAKQYTPLTRYIWGDVPIYQLAASLWKNAYLSHGSAVFLHGLTKDIPKTIYVNKQGAER